MVSSWVGRRLNYVPGSSDPIDGAADTLLSGEGVCRDCTHLVVALLRSRCRPAWCRCTPRARTRRIAARWPRLLSRQWRVVDATLLAPRQSLVRITTGRVAAGPPEPAQTVEQYVTSRPDLFSS